MHELENINAEEDEYLYTYSLGALAVEYLAIRHGGNGAVMNFWRTSQDPRDLTEAGGRAAWADTFEDAFGIALHDFYEAFAQYRADGFKLERE